MSDDKDMRDLLDKDFEELETKLQNGHGGDPEIQGRAIALMMRHMRVLVRRNTVTEEECAKRMATCAGACAVVELRKEQAKTQNKSGADAAALLANPWMFMATTAMKWIPTPVLAAIVLIGFLKGWW